MKENCSHCILVVEDDPSIRRLIVASLTRSGYEIVEARNGREALEQMTNGSAHLIVLDLMMPEVTGWEVLRQRAKNPEMQKIPVIVVSANSGPEITEVLSKGICALLPKPFDLEALNAIVKSCLDHPHGTDAATTPV